MLRWHKKLNPLEERPSTEGRLKSLVVKPGQTHQKENSNKKLKSAKKGNKASTSSKAPNKGNKFDLNTVKTAIVTHCIQRLPVLCDPIWVRPTILAIKLHCIKRLTVLRD
jgi:hypothetical protein